MGDGHSKLQFFSFVILVGGRCFTHESLILMYAIPLCSLVTFVSTLTYQSAFKANVWHQLTEDAH